MDWHVQLIFRWKKYETWHHFVHMFQRTHNTETLGANNKSSKVSIYFSDEWVRDFTNTHDFYETLVGWYEEGNNLKAKYNK
jgi:hypothetical protein